MTSSHQPPATGKSFGKCHRESQGRQATRKGTLTYCENKYFINLIIAVRRGKRRTYSLTYLYLSLAFSCHSWWEKWKISLGHTQHNNWRPWVKAWGSHGELPKPKGPSSTNGKGYALTHVDTSRDIQNTFSDKMFNHITETFQCSAKKNRTILRASLSAPPQTPHCKDSCTWGAGNPHKPKCASASFLLGVCALLKHFCSRSDM